MEDPETTNRQVVEAVDQQYLLNHISTAFYEDDAPEAA